MNVRALTKAYPGYCGTNVAEGAEGYPYGLDGAGADDGAKDVSDGDTMELDCHCCGHITRDQSCAMMWCVASVVASFSQLQLARW